MSFFSSVTHGLAHVMRSAEHDVAAAAHVAKSVASKAVPDVVKHHLDEVVAFSTPIGLAAVVAGTVGHHLTGQAKPKPKPIGLDWSAAVKGSSKKMASDMFGRLR